MIFYRGLPKGGFKTLSPLLCLTNHVNALNPLLSFAFRLRVASFSYLERAEKDSFESCQLESRFGTYLDHIWSNFRPNQTFVEWYVHSICEKSLEFDTKGANWHTIRWTYRVACVGQELLIAYTEPELSSSKLLDPKSLVRHNNIRIKRPKRFHHDNVLRSRNTKYFNWYSEFNWLKLIDFFRYDYLIYYKHSFMF